MIRQKVRGREKEGRGEGECPGWPGEELHWAALGAGLEVGGEGSRFGVSQRRVEGSEERSF